MLQPDLSRRQARTGYSCRSAELAVLKEDSAYVRTWLFQIGPGLILSALLSYLVHPFGRADYPNVIAEFIMQGRYKFLSVRRNEIKLLISDLHYLKGVVLFGCRLLGIAFAQTYILEALHY